MASLFACFISYLLFFLPGVHCLDQDHKTCGNVSIKHPFYLSATGDGSFQNHSALLSQNRIYKILCDYSIPILKLNEIDYIVREIIYEKNSLLLHDKAISSYWVKGHCGFLYAFATPIHNFNLPAHSRLLGSQNLAKDCGSVMDAISQTCFPMLNHSSHCNGYSLYYWDEPKDQPKVPSRCLVPEAQASFQWELSFGGAGDNFSLISVGFSSELELREDCLYCQVTGRNCTASNAAADSSCSCGNICEKSGKRYFSISCLELKNFFHDRDIDILCPIYLISL